MRQDRQRSLASAAGCSHRFIGDKEKLENAIYAQSHITCDVTFDAGTAVITPRGKDTGDKAAFFVARLIAKEMGFPNAKQG